MAASMSFEIDATCAIFDDLKDLESLGIFSTTSELSLEMDSLPWDWQSLDIEPTIPAVAEKLAPRRSRKQSLEERKEETATPVETKKPSKKIPKYALPIEDDIPLSEKKRRMKAIRSHDFREKMKMEKQKDHMKILALEKTNTELEEKMAKLQAENDALKRRLNL